MTEGTQIDTRPGNKAILGIEKNSVCYDIYSCYIDILSKIIQNVA